MSLTALKTFALLGAVSSSATTVESTTAKTAKTSKTGKTQTLQSLQTTKSQTLLSKFKFRDGQKGKMSSKSKNKSGVKSSSKAKGSPFLNPFKEKDFRFMDEMNPVAPLESIGSPVEQSSVAG